MDQELKEQGFRDILRILAEVPSPPTISLWYQRYEEDEEDEKDKCDRCGDPAEWIAAVPFEGPGRTYAGTFQAYLCGTCVASMVVKAETMTREYDGDDEPIERESWPIR